MRVAYVISELGAFAADLTLCHDVSLVVCFGRLADSLSICAWVGCVVTAQRRMLPESGVWGNTVDALSPALTTSNPALYTPPLLTIIHTASNVLSDPGRFKVLSPRLASIIMGRGGQYALGSFE